jgi:hypothetical protein
MALGYCKTCDRLVTITLAPSPWADAEPDARDLAEVRRNEVRKTVWVPVQHDHEGRPCPGVRRPI